MNRFQIKLLAAATMLIDHIGLYFFPKFIILRLIGRIAFPLFAWFVANGLHHTRDVKSYVRDLLLLAFVSQIPFMLLYFKMGGDSLQLNAVFTLVLGLVGSLALRKFSNIFLQIGAVALCVLIAVILNTDYGAWGVLSVIAFSVTLKNLRRLVIAQLTLFVACYVVPAILPQVNLDALSVALTEATCLLALFVIGLYNEKKGSRLKYFFYAFYPLHLLILYLIKMFM